MAHRVVRIKVPKGDLVTLTNSSRSMFLNCQQKYQYSYEELLTPKQTKGFLAVGNIFHKGCENVLKGISVPNLQQLIRKEIKTSRRQVVGDPVRFEKESSILEGMMTGYYKNQSILKNAKVPVLNGRPTLEMPYTLDMGRGLILKGKIDALVQLSDGYWIVERKSTGRLDANFVNKLPMDSQITTYLYAAKKILPPQIAKRINGVIYDVVGKTQIRRKQKETEVQFYERVVKEYLNPANRFKYFYQKKQFRTDAELLRFEVEAHTTADNIRKCRSTGVWQRNSSFCTYYSTCEFLQVCTQGKKAHVMASFVKRDNPHHETVEEEIT